MADDGRPLAPSLYDADGYSWALAQADALRRRAAGELDWDNLAEEIDSLARSDVRELVSRLAVLLAHLLKWRYQPERRSRSWEATIRLQRQQALRLLGENPGLKHRLDGHFAVAYADARVIALGETSLPLETFPEAPAFSLAETLNADFWPPEAP